MALKPVATAPPPQGRLQRRAWLTLLAAALLIVWLGAGTNVDLTLADAAFNARLGAFAWRDAWLADTFGRAPPPAIACRQDTRRARCG